MPIAALPPSHSCTASPDPPGAITRLGARILPPGCSGVAQPIPFRAKAPTFFAAHSPFLRGLARTKGAGHQSPLARGARVLVGRRDRSTSPCGKESGLAGARLYRRDTTGIVLITYCIRARKERRGSFLARLRSAGDAGARAGRRRRV